MIYQIFFILLIVLGYIIVPKGDNPKDKLTYIVYVCIILTLQSGLRHLAIGSDTFQYFQRFIDSGESSWKEIWLNFSNVYILGEGKDAGYPFVEKIFYTYISTSYQLYLICIAIFLFTTFGILMNRFCQNTLDVLVATATYFLLFYNFFSITGIRQTISTACSIHCFLALLDKKYLKYIIFFIIAFFIHKSAAIILVFPFLLMIKDFRLISLVSIILFVVAFFNRDFLVNYFRELADYEVFNIRLPFRLMLFYFIFSVCIFLYMRKFYNGLEGDSTVIRKLYNMYIPTFSCIPLLGWDSLFMREILYFSFYGMFLIPLFLRWIKQDLVLYGFIIFCFIMFIVQNNTYGFFWQDIVLGSNYN